MDMDHTGWEGEQDQRHLPVIDRVDAITGRPPRKSLVAEGRCVIEPNKNERGPRCITDGGTFNRALMAMAVYGD